MDISSCTEPMPSSGSSSSSEAQAQSPFLVNTPFALDHRSTWYCKGPWTPDQDGPVQDLPTGLESSGEAMSESRPHLLPVEEASSESVLSVSNLK